MSHPYRQANGITASAPHPVDDFVLAEKIIQNQPNSNGQNNKTIKVVNDKYYKPDNGVGNGFGDDGYEVNQQQAQGEQYAKNSENGYNQYGDNETNQYPIKDQDGRLGYNNEYNDTNTQFEDNLNNSNISNHANSNSNPGLSYTTNDAYSYPAQPQSPKFSTSNDLYNQILTTNHKVQNNIVSPTFNTSKDISPSSASLSTGSSVTNLNLNVPMDSNFSKSETNLLTPLRNQHRFGHTRSVSSTSSFFYDRSTDNVSMVDFSQNVIQQYLGSNSTNLLPRIKTIELYRKNAKKSSDPAVIFQYAQYILQTALLLDDLSNNSSNKNSNINSTKTSPKQQDDANTARTPEAIDEKKFKTALIKESIHYLKKLSDKGYSEAQYLLADAYSSGALGKVDNKDAFLLFVHAAKHGHVESAYRTSYCYEEGLGTGRDARKSIEYLKIAAAKNHPAAMYKLGIYSFYSRMGLPSNMNTKKSGIQWLTRATNIANELIAAAPYELGKIYFNGFEDIVIQDKKYALELYSQAAALGHVQSASILGLFYESGDIVPQDGNLSIHYYTQAALGGDPDAMLSMCAWYLVGCDPHLPKDENEAFEWAKRAANCNLPKAQFALANFYEKGIGCIKNATESQMWYKRAAENGDENSLTRITDHKVLSDLKSKKIKKKTSKSNSSAEEKDCVIM